MVSTELSLTWSNASLLIALTVIAVSYVLFQRDRARPASPSSSLRISEIYVYPIKSLRPARLHSALATQHGFQYDRIFMLLQKTDNGWKNMHVTDYPWMTQFLVSLHFSKGDSAGHGHLVVEFDPPEGKSSTIQVPLKPDASKLETIDISMHSSRTSAFKMPAEYSAWFSERFGFEVLFAYQGNNFREVLFEDLKPGARLARFLKRLPLPNLGHIGQHQITFADCAPYLVASRTSLVNVSSRLVEDEEVDITKFRPNIVVSGAQNPWEEDFWGSMNINGLELMLPHNCVRCKSINIDYSTGEPGTGESGQILKKLQKDRRVDPGAKWSPVFGRYAYWSGWSGPSILSEGDSVIVTKKNAEHTRFSWPGLG